MDMNIEEGVEEMENNEQPPILTEVTVSDDVPIDDEESVAQNNDADGYDDDEMLPDVVEMALCSFTQHTDSVYSAAINPKIPGLIITGGGDDMAYLWKYNCSSSPTTIEKSIQLAGHTDTVASAGFNFDGTLALTGSYDGTVRIWDAITGELKQCLEGPEDVEFAQWHSKGNAVMAGSRDGTVWMWMAHNGQCIQVFAGHDGGVSAGCFSTDGKAVCTGGEDGTVRIWAPKLGSCRHVFEGHFGHAAVVTCLVSSQDGDLLLSGSADGTVKLLQISGKRVLQTFQHSKSQPIAIDAAASTAAARQTLTSKNSSNNGNKTKIKSNKQQQQNDNTNNNNKELYDIGENSEDITFDNNDDDNAAMDDDDDNSSNGDHDNNNDENDDESDGEEVDVEEYVSVECVDFSSPEYKWIASGGLDKTLKIWDSVSGACRGICTHPASVVSLQWHKTLPVVTTAALDCVVRLFDARAGTLLQELTGHSDMVTSIFMAPLWTMNSDYNSSDSNSSSSSDVIVSVSDDKTARVFHVDIPALLLQQH